MIVDNSALVKNTFYMIAPHVIVQSHYYEMDATNTSEWLRSVGMTDESFYMASKGSFASG